jgi:hypothetical protein
MLPLGQRVQKKLEALIDKHMSKLGKSPESTFLLRLLTAGRRFQVRPFFNFIRSTLGKKWPLKISRP